MSHSTTPDYYELLGVSRDADTATITRAYRRLARMSHPDSGGNAGMFRLLRTAYETLTDDEERRAYDTSLASPADSGTDGDASADATGEPDEGSAGDAAAGAQWQFADGTARSLVVDPERLTWWPDVDASRAVRVEPAYARGRLEAAVAAAAFLVIAGGMVAIHPFGAVPLMAGTALIAAVYLRAYRGADVRSVAAVAGVLAVVSTGVYMYASAAVLAPPLAIGLLAALCAACVLVHRFARAALLDRLAPREAVAQIEYGRPGEGHRSETDDGRFGDRIGADALLPLTMIPGVRIFHGLAEPDGGEVVSHAVVCGRLVGLVASKVWEPGCYSWTPHGALLRDGAHFAAGDLGFDTTVAAYRQALANSVDDVRGFVLVAASRPGSVTGGTGPTGLTVGDPQAVVEELGAWFLRAGRVELVDRSLLVRLYEHRAATIGGSR